MNRKAMNEAVREHFLPLMPERIAVLGAKAVWDLYYGPIRGCDRCGADSNAECTCEIKWLGFATATAEVTEWCASVVGDVWYNGEWGEVRDSEPCDSDYEDSELWYKLEARDVKGILFDKELAGYV